MFIDFKLIEIVDLWFLIKIKLKYFINCLMFRRGNKKENYFKIRRFKESLFYSVINGKILSYGVLVKKVYFFVGFDNRIYIVNEFFSIYFYKY